MEKSLLEILFLAGFLFTWVGAALWTVTMMARLFRPWWQSLGLPWRERTARFSEHFAQEFLNVGKTFPGRWGQRAMTLGLSIMMLAGVLWLAQKILPRTS